MEKTFITVSNSKYSRKLRWGVHPEHPSLSQLHIKSLGVWYTIEGTTLPSVAEKQKLLTLEEYAVKLGLT